MIRNLFWIRSQTVFISLALFSMALSVSATHILIGFFFIAYFINYIKSKPQIRVQSINQSIRQLPGLLIAGGLLYSGLLLSALVHTVSSPDSLAYLQSIAQSELSDSLLYVFALLVFIHLRNHPSEIPKIQKALLFFCIALIATGLVALFSEFRLSRLARGFPKIASALNRPQHPFIMLAGIQLYRPIGFMNTRLTYGGLLLLIQPWIWQCLFTKSYNILNRFNTRFVDSKYFYRSIATGLFYLFLCCSSLLLVLANGARSIQLGLLFVLPLSILFWILKHTRLLEKLRVHIKKRKKSLMATLSGLALLAVLVFGGILHFDYSGDLIGHASAGIRHTDYSRPLIWKSSLDLSLQNPLLGVGPGNFKSATLAWRVNFLSEYPALYYFVNNAPDGHAHNDLLHISTVGGFITALIYLLLIFGIVRQSNHPAALGMLGLCLAGMVQCYFQDDEVVVLFWFLAAILSTSKISDAQNVNLHTELLN